MNEIRHALQDQFHKSLTLQRPDDISCALRMVGVMDLWGKCGKALREKPESIKTRLNFIVSRRNQMVHEGDLKKFRRGGKATLISIKATDVRDDVEWMKGLVTEIDKVLP